MFNWIKAKLGYHVCEEFTQWKRRVMNYSRDPSPGDYSYVTGKQITWTESWQERRCTLCGKIQQEVLEHHYRDVEDQKIL